MSIRDTMRKLQENLSLNEESEGNKKFTDKERLAYLKQIWKKTGKDYKDSGRFSLDKGVLRMGPKGTHSKTMSSFTDEEIRKELRLKESEIFELTHGQAPVPQISGSLGEGAADANEMVRLKFPDKSNSWLEGFVSGYDWSRVESSSLIRSAIPQSQNAEQRAGFKAGQKSFENGDEWSW